jgi:hypothetical protein
MKRAARLGRLEDWWGGPAGPCPECRRAFLLLYEVGRPQPELPVCPTCGRPWQGPVIWLPEREADAAEELEQKSPDGPLPERARAQPRV